MAKLQLNTLIKYAAKQGNKSPMVVTIDMVESIYNAINNAVFNGMLTMPKIIVYDYTKRCIWGECEGLQRGSRWGPHYTLAIRITKQFPNMKKLIGVIAHEMVHQYEWDFQGVMTHGSTFFAWEGRLKSKGIRIAVVQ